MILEVIERSENRAKILIKGITPIIANTIRRLALTNVPTMAIDDVIIVENTTPMYDEIIASRLGLIPLKTDLTTYNLPSECECGGQGCTSCEVTLTLEKYAEKDIEVVYAKDLESHDPETVAVHPDIPILKMSKDQKVSLEAIARLGTGKEHAKWQPVSTIAYKGLPQIEFNTENCVLCENCIEACPKSIIEIKDENIYATHIMDCILCNQCAETCELDAVNVSASETDFIFSIESTGSLSIKTILLEAINILRSKAEILKVKVNEL